MRVKFITISIQSIIIILFLTTLIVLTVTIPLQWYEDYCLICGAYIVSVFITLITMYVLMIFVVQHKIAVIYAVTILRSIFVVLPALKYIHVDFDPYIDGCFHQWFSMEILRNYRVPQNTIYSDMPLAHILLSILSMILGKTPALIDKVQFVLIEAIILSSLFIYLLLVNKTYKNVFVRIFIFVIGIPFEFFFPLYFRPRIYASIFLLLMIYIIYKYKMLSVRYIITLIVLYISSLLSNISYAFIFTLTLLFSLLLIWLKEKINAPLHDITCWKLIRTVTLLMVVISVVYVAYTSIIIGEIIGVLKRVLLIFTGEIEKLTTYNTLLSLNSFDILIGIIVTYNVLLLVPVMYMYFIIMIRKLIKNNMNYIFFLSLIIIFPIISFTLNVSTNNFANTLRPLYVMLLYLPLLIYHVITIISEESPTGPDKYTYKHQNMRKNMLAKTLSAMMVVSIFSLYIVANLMPLYITPSIHINIVVNDNDKFIDDNIYLVVKSLIIPATRIHSILYIKEYLMDNSRILLISDRGFIYATLRYTSYNFFYHKTLSISELLRRSAMVNNNEIFINISKFISEMHNFYITKIIIVNIDPAMGSYFEVLEYRSRKLYIIFLDEISNLLNIIYNIGSHFILISK